MLEQNTPTAQQSLYLSEDVRESVMQHAPSSNDLMATVHLLESDRHSRAVANDGTIVHDDIVGNRVEMNHEFR